MYMYLYRYVYGDMFISASHTVYVTYVEDIRCKMVQRSWLLITMKVNSQFWPYLIAFALTCTFLKGRLFTWKINLCSCSSRCVMTVVLESSNKTSHVDNLAHISSVPFNYWGPEKKSYTYNQQLKSILLPCLWLFLIGSRESAIKIIVFSGQCELMNIKL